MNNPDEAVIVVSQWRPGALRAYSAALIKRALALRREQVFIFGPDDLADSDREVSPSIPGLAMRALCRAGVIRKTFCTAKELGVRFGRRVSESESRRGSEIQLSELVGEGIAHAWLKTNGIEPPEPKQGELKI
jgi:hypothetical protein